MYPYKAVNLQESLKAISQKLKQFRPAATVLEAEVAPARRNGTIDSAASNSTTDPSNFHAVMKRKRESHDGTIKVRSCRSLDVVRGHATSIHLGSKMGCRNDVTEEKGCRNDVTEDKEFG